MRETYAAAPPNLQPVEKNILIDTKMHIIIHIGIFPINCYMRNFEL